MSAKNVGRDGKDSYKRYLRNLLFELFPGRISTSPNVKIVPAIFKVITDALRRGEKVQIQGLGTFRVREYAPRDVVHRYSYLGDFNEAASVPGTIPRRKVVVFIPAKGITSCR